MQLARDARSSGDPVAAENYYQHAEHYFRLIAAAQEQFRQNQPQPRTENEMASEDGDDESESFSNFGQEPGFVPVQPQPFVPRDNNPRDHQREGQPYQRRPASAPRTLRPSRTSSAAAVSAAAQPQPVIPDNVSVDRLPSFITGPQPQISGGPGGFEGGGGERFPRRRRRPHGPRPEGMAAPRPPGTISIRGTSKRLPACGTSQILTGRHHPPSCGRPRKCLPRTAPAQGSDSSRCNDDGTSTGSSAGISRVRSRCAGIAR